MTDERIPWWALLVHAPSARVEAELEKLRWPDGDDEDDTKLVASPDGTWTAIYRYDRNELDLQIAAKLRALGEVIALSFDDYRHVRRFEGTRWKIFEEDPAAVERSHGFVRGAPAVSEKTREAALIIGGDRAALAKRWPGAERVVETERGVVVTGAPAGFAARRSERRAYHVSNALAGGDFHVFVVEDGGHTGLFQRPEGPTGGIPELADIEGETEPREIVRALGLPEEYLFP